MILRFTVSPRTQPKPASARAQSAHFLRAGGSPDLRERPTNTGHCRQLYRSHLAQLVVSIVTDPFDRPIKRKLIDSIDSRGEFHEGAADDVPVAHTLHARSRDAELSPPSLRNYAFLTVALIFFAAHFRSPSAPVPVVDR